MVTPTDIKLFKDAAIEAGLEVRKMYLDGTATVYEKDNEVSVFGADVVTEADYASDRILKARLKPLGIPIISEESYKEDFAAIPETGTYIMIDPVDGTAGLRDRKPGNFCVMFGLVVDYQPAAGIVYVPDVENNGYGELFVGCKSLDYSYAQHSGHKPRDTPFRENTSLEDATAILSSQTYTKEDMALVERLGIERLFSVGSIGVKAVHMMKGNGDIYPNHDGLYMWDVLPAQAILEAAGGHVRNKHGHMLDWRLKVPRNIPGRFTDGIIMFRDPVKHTHVFQ